MRYLAAATVVLSTLVLGLGRPLRATDGGTISILTDNHYVNVKSTAPAIAGQTAVLYVRERRLVGPVPKPAALADRVVLFVHGAGTPAEVAFDVPLRDFSWMAFLARAGFDTFAVDMTGYGRSTRPAPMNDPCNLAGPAQAPFVGLLIPAPCKPDVDAGRVDAGIGLERCRCGGRLHPRAPARGQDRSVGWSMGGPRAGGYAAEHPDKISKMVLLAPAYGGGGRGAAPASTAGALARGTTAAAGATTGAAGRGGAARGGAARGAAPEQAAGGARGGALRSGRRCACGRPRRRRVLNTQSHEDLVALWNRQAPCPRSVQPGDAGSRLFGAHGVGSGRRPLGPGRASRAVWRRWRRRDVDQRDGARRR